MTPLQEAIAREIATLERCRKPKCQVCTDRRLIIAAAEEAGKLRACLERLVKVDGLRLDSIISSIREESIAFREAYAREYEPAIDAARALTAAPLTADASTMSGTWPAHAGGGSK